MSTSPKDGKAFFLYLSMVLHDRVKMHLEALCAIKGSTASPIHVKAP